MKKIIFLILIMAVSTISMDAQLKETFDSNSWQWTEQSTNLGKVYIVDGVLRFDTNTPMNIDVQKVAENVSSHAYLPFDPIAGFTITCDAMVDEIGDDKYFGVIMDYKDEMNYMCFIMSQNKAYLYNITEGRITRKWTGQLRLPKQKKASIDLKITYSGGDLEIRVNDIQAVHAKYAPIESNGFGFFAFGKTKIDFDNVEILF